MNSYFSDSGYGSYYMGDRVPTMETYDPTTARYGRTGLSNLGNTCYMNTAIQCLSHVPVLSRFLLTDEFKEYINRENKSGSGGKVVEAFADLIKMLWLGSSSSITPRAFKETVGEFASQFRGYDQHDSQEFMIMLLDLIHEDLNKVTVKPYIELPTYNSFDPSQSSAMWAYHLQRQNSQIVDWFYGQTVTEIECCECGERRVKYEPFSMLSLPLPPERISLTVNVLPGFFTGIASSSPSRPITFNLLVTDSVKRLRSLLADQLHETPSKILLVSFSRGTIRVIDDASPLPQTADRLLVYLVVDETPSHVVTAGTDSAGIPGICVAGDHSVKNPHSRRGN